MAKLKFLVQGPFWPLFEPWAPSGPKRAHLGPKCPLLAPKYLAPWGPLSPSGAPKRAFRSQNGPFWGPWSAVEVCKGAQAHDMDAYHPDTLCRSVLDASRPVSAVPRTQRGPKGALGQKISILSR